MRNDDPDIGVEAVDNLLGDCRRGWTAGRSGGQPSPWVPSPSTGTMPGVFQRACNLGLGQEAAATRQIVGPHLEDLLDGHLAVALGVQGHEDGAEAACSFDAEDLSLRAGAG
jgi:hypothetical protein